jgi:hypothetical protein
MLKILLFRKLGAIIVRVVMSLVIQRINGLHIILSSGCFGEIGNIYSAVWQDIIVVWLVFQSRFVIVKYSSPVGISPTTLQKHVSRLLHVAIDSGQL